MFPSSFMRLTFDCESPVWEANWLMVSHLGAVVIIWVPFRFLGCNTVCTECIIVA